MDGKGYLTFFELKSALAFQDLALPDVVKICYFFDSSIADKIFLEDFTKMSLDNIQNIKNM